MNTTYIQQQRQHYTANRQYILETFEISEADYYNFMFETGCLFLELFYPESEGFKEYYEKYSRLKTYWAWWKHEFKQREAACVRHLQDIKEQATVEAWENLMHQMVYDHEVSASYYNNYLKNIQL